MDKVITKITWFNGISIKGRLMDLVDIIETHINIPWKFYVAFDTFAHTKKK